ncbi:MAG: hypothetical protein Q8P83_04095 [bacterium]|nr:hypothetical protein [bacterium]
MNPKSKVLDLIFLLIEIIPNEKNQSNNYDQTINHCTKVQTKRQTIVGHKKITRDKINFRDLIN